MLTIPRDWNISYKVHPVSAQGECARKLTSDAQDQKLLHSPNLFMMKTLLGENHFL